MDATSISTELQWKHHGYDRFRMFVHEIPGDGSCLIHSICFNLYVPYHTRRFEGKNVTRRHVVRMFRHQIADKLTEINPGTGDTYYAGLGLNDKEVPEYSLSSISSLLRSNNSLTITELYIISKVIDVNVYVLSDDTKDIYVLDRLRRDRRSIVIYHSREHFRPVSVIDGFSQNRMTHFEHNHPFIVHLRNRHNKLKSAGRY